MPQNPQTQTHPNPTNLALSMNTAPSLNIGGLETVYDALASAIDQAGADNAPLFLVKLALLNANALADAALFERHVQAALQDL